MRAADGKVTVSVLMSIDATGKVNDAKVVASTGEPTATSPHLRLAALSAARQWRFRPAVADGKPVPSQVTVLFTF
jgi:TonB family protein